MQGKTVFICMGHMAIPSSWLGIVSFGGESSVVLVLARVWTVVKSVVRGTFIAVPIMDFGGLDEVGPVVLGSRLTRVSEIVTVDVVKVVIGGWVDGMEVLVDTRTVLVEVTISDSVPVDFVKSVIGGWVDGMAVLVDKSTVLI